MSKKIKLENFIEAKQSHKHNGIEYNKSKYCPICGEPTVVITSVTEYGCSTCRHKINENDNFCGFCGTIIDQEERVEHYIGGIALNDALFSIIKKEIEKRE
ncbi:MAG: zinc ribbon domain-containing protein [Proteobacteria bacterium]|nr:zinc ribbon domain-containing protein [Pseudomonadota bacterium]